MRRRLSWPNSGSSPRSVRADDGAHPRHRAQQLLLRPPDRTLLDGVVEVSIDRAPLALKPPDVGVQTAPHRRQRMLETMAFGDQYPHNLSASSEQGVEGDQRLIGQRPRRRADAFGEERERVRVDAVCLCELPRRPREVPDLARIDHDHGQPDGRQRRDGRAFVDYGAGGTFTRHVGRIIRLSGSSFSSGELGSGGRSGGGRPSPR